MMIPGLFLLAVEVSGILLAVLKLDVQQWANTFVYRNEFVTFVSVLVADDERQFPVGNSSGRTTARFRFLSR